jgi:regulator of sigma E protease
MIFDILVFVFVLGLLVFFHELGHFLAAKAVGVYCDRFSLGMPPRVWGKRIGETDYCLGLLPIGGYVKMAGQEDAPKTEDEREQEYGHVPPERWFNNKPVWQRAIIVVAGPSMNLVLAVLLYAIVAGVGANVPESEVSNRIGLIEAGAPAATAPLFPLADGETLADIAPGEEPAAIGWQTGDYVVSMNDQKVTNISDIHIAAVLNANEQVRVVIERPMEDGSLQRFASFIQPEKMEEAGQAVFGVAPFYTALVGDTLVGTPAEQNGLQPGDVIAKLNGEIIDAETFSRSVEGNTSGSPLLLTVQRGEKEFQVPLSPEIKGNFEGISFTPPVDLFLQLPREENPAVVVESPWFGGNARTESFFETTPFKHGDVIIQVDGVDATAAQLHQLEKQRENTVTVTVERKDGLLGFLKEPERVTFETSVDDLMYAVTGIDDSEVPVVAHLTPEAAKATGLKRGDRLSEVEGEPATVGRLRRLEEQRRGEELTVKAERRAPWYAFGGTDEVLASTLPVTSVGAVGIAWEMKYVFHREPLQNIIPAALQDTYTAFDRTVKTVVMLVSGKVSTRDLGGPVMIYQITTKAARLGYAWLLTITAFISVNLCVFNLLPLPVLDGGLLVVLGLEGVRRKPVDARILERVQQVGLAFIILLILFVTYNDIYRIVIGNSI